ncbi:MULTISPECIES: MFS transporter [Bradyrhizobium]|uniref:MFS transporter n=1 Tax=Bradyrhizobium TaxID=374 RepID=UPI0006876B38|nr:MULTISPECIES: MFS transporter [Bradyrhizobium]UFW46480.1 MFS transporter [Bradyrhizobium arachidis]
MFSALLFAYLLSNFYRAFLAVIASELARNLSINVNGVASLQASFLLAFAFAQLPVGVALDLYGPRNTLIVGLCGAVMGGVLLGTAIHFIQALVAMSLLGAGFAPVLMTGFYMIARNYPPERFAPMSSLLFGLGSLGDPISGIPLTLAKDAFGWRPTMLMMAVITAGSLAWVAAVVRNPPRVEAPGGLISALVRARQIVGIRSLWPILPLAFVSYAVVAATRGLWIAPYLTQVHGFDPDAVGLSATAMGVSIAAGGLIFAPLNRLCCNAKYTVATAVASTVVAWLVLGVNGSGSGALALGLLLFAACFGASFAIVLAHAASFMPAHLLGQGVTMMNLVFFGGAGLGQWLSGHYVRAAQLAGVAPADLYGRLFTAFGTALAVALCCYLFAPRELE